jgi:hypothetical protein
MIPEHTNTQFYTGVVEDRNDPLFLGRCRVRVHGVHSKFKAPVSETSIDVASGDYIPIDQLPWAMPMQPITSSAMTGLRTTPLGPVEGTWVLVFFLDGDDKQLPVMVGTIGGIELKQDQQDNSQTPGLNLSTDNPIPEPEGSPIDDTPTQVPTDDNIQDSTGGVLGPLTAEQYKAYKDALGKRESGNNYKAVNQFGYVGKYQFGNQALYDAGYTVSSRANNSLMLNTANWSGKDGVNSRDDYLNNPQAQENGMDTFTANNYRTLLANGTLDANSSPQDVAGYLAVSHLLGTGAARRLKQNGTDGADGNGTRGSTYYNLGANAVGGGPGAKPRKPPSDTRNTKPKPNFPVTPSQPANSPSSFSDAEGFKDPNKIYPKFEDQQKRPDTSFLAYSDHLDKTYVTVRKQAKEKGVDVALHVVEPWDEPDPAYNASYPKNHVLETESGHVMEFDDTPGSERINLWHRKGTFFEIDCNGSIITHVVGDMFHIMERNGNVFIAGRCNITIGGDANVYVKNNANLQVDGKTKAKFHNDVSVEASGDFDLNVKGDLNFKAKSVHFETKSDDRGESFTVKNTSSGGIKFESFGTIDLFAEDNMRLYSNDKLSIRATGNEVAIDGHYLTLQKGSSETAHLVDTDLGGDYQMLSVDAKQNPKEPDFQDLSVTTGSDKVAFFYDDGSYPADEVQNFIQNQLNNGNYSKNDLNRNPNLDKPDNQPPPPATQEPVLPPAGYENADTYSPALQLSPNLTLSQLSSTATSVPMSIVPQRGLSEGQIASNLFTVANTTLEPILAQYPNMQVVSGFRAALNSTTISQHELGQAVDLQFVGATPDAYYSIAVWIRDNCTYDQLILNYSTVNGGTPFIHVSVQQTGNSKQVLTMLNHQVIAGSLSDTLKSQSSARIAFGSGASTSTRATIQ